MKKKIYYITLTVSFAFLFLFSLSLASSFLELKSSRTQYGEFWSDPNDYDVWLLGTSHMYYGIHPMTLWNEYGIRSYNLAASGNYMPQTYWTFRNALCYGQPKAVLIDCYHIGQEDKTKSDASLVHAGFDSIPLSPTKVRAACDLFDTAEQRMEFLFNFYIYHNRWDSLSWEDFKPPVSLQKGAKSSGAVSDQTSFSLIEQTDMLSSETTGHFYLRKIIKECQERGIQVILTGIPQCVGPKSQRGINSAAKLAEEYGVPFLNMAYDKGLAIDYRTDFKDKGHLNVLGARKVSEYVGNYLKENYPLLWEKADGASERKWKAGFDAYKKQKNRTLKKVKKLEQYLAWLTEPEYSLSIYQSESAILPGSVTDMLLNKCAGKTEKISLNQAKALLGQNFAGDVAIIVKDTDTREEIDTAIFKNGIRQE